MRPVPRHRRRGAAMLLVLIALGTATVLTTAYLSSRDNSAAIGGNVASSATARWAAVSGIDLGVALMETPTNWRTAHASGLLLDDYAIGGATIDLCIIDLETGIPPVADSTWFELTCVATAGGIEQTVIATTEVALPAESVGVDVDLSEFVIFGTERIELSEQATIGHWPGSPVGGKKLALGTQGLAAGTVTINDDAAAIDTTVYHGPGASGSLVLNSGAQPVETSGLPDQIPMPGPPTTSVAPPDAGTPFPPLILAAGNLVLNADSRFDTIDLSSNAQLTIQGDQVIVGDGSLNISAGASLIIDGNVTVVVFDDLSLDGGAIEITENGSLTLYVGDQLDVNDGYVGEQAFGAVFGPGQEPYLDPERIRFFEQSALGQNWSIGGTTVFKGSLYTATDVITVQNQATVYGRMAARRVYLGDTSGLYYDHTLDTLNGYTNPDSGAFDGAGSVITAFADLISLSPGHLQAAADDCGFPVWSGHFAYEDSGALQTMDDLLNETGLLVDIRDGTLLNGSIAPDRTETVEYDITSLGADIATWEASR